MSAPDLRLLSFGKSILFVSGARPFRLDKVQHYRDRPFKDLLARYGDMKASPPTLGEWKDADIGPLLGGAGRSAQTASAESNLTNSGRPAGTIPNTGEEAGRGVEPPSDSRDMKLIEMPPAMTSEWKGSTALNVAGTAKTDVEMIDSAISEPKPSSKSFTSRSVKTGKRTATAVAVPVKRRLNSAPPIPGVQRDYPIREIAEIAKSESDSSLLDMTTTLENASAVGELALSLKNLHAGFGGVNDSAGGVTG